MKPNVSAELLKHLDKLIGPFPERLLRLTLDMQVEECTVTVVYMPVSHEPNIVSKKFKIEEIKDES